MTVVLGSDVLIPCEYSGADSVLPFWRRNDEIFYSLHLPVKYSFNQSGLTIHKITLAMNLDRYSCSIDLSDGHYESTIGVIMVTQIRVLSQSENGINIIIVSVYNCYC